MASPQVSNSILSFLFPWPHPFDAPYLTHLPPTALQNPTDAAAVVAREIAVPPTAVDIPVTKRDVSTSAFDEVNLNVDGDAGVTMTFVESLDDEDQDDE